MSPSVRHLRRHGIIAIPTENNPPTKVPGRWIVLTRLRHRPRNRSVVLQRHPFQSQGEAWSWSTARWQPYLTKIQRDSLQRIIASLNYPTSLSQGRSQALLCSLAESRRTSSVSSHGHVYSGAAPFRTPLTKCSGSSPLLLSCPIRRMCPGVRRTICVQHQATTSALNYPNCPLGQHRGAVHTWIVCFPVTFSRLYAELQARALQ